MTPQDSERKDAAYQARIAEEVKVFAGNEEVHNLPPIFHYWSNKYVRPRLRSLGIGGSMELFADALREQCEIQRDRAVRFASVGSGNCDQEIQFAAGLRARGHHSF